MQTDNFVIDFTLYEGLESTLYDELDDNPKAEYEANKQRRMHWCCTFKIEARENVTTGTRTYNTARCDLVECPICGPIIKNKLSKGIESQLMNGPTNIMRGIDDKERAKVARKLGKDNYQSFPVEQEDGSIRYDILVKDETMGDPYTSVSNEDLTNWSKTVYGKAKSGNLCKSDKAASPGPETEDMEEKRVPVETWNYILDLDEIKDCSSTSHACQVIEAEVIKETNNLKPTSITELKACLDIRRNKFAEVVSRHNGVILYVKRRIIMIRESDIDWSLDKNARFKQESSG